MGFDLEALKQAHTIDSKDQVTETGIWYHRRLEEYQGYVVLDEKRKYLVTLVTARFLANDPDPQALFNQLLQHVFDFQNSKRK